MPAPRLPARLAAAACLLAAAVAAGCTSTAAPERGPTAQRAENVVQGAAPGEDGRVLGPDETPSLAEAPHTAADVAFLQKMVHHHAQALVLVDLVEGRGDDRVALMAERMGVSQTAEIEAMETWLQLRGEDVPDWKTMGLAFRLRVGLDEYGDDEGHGRMHGDDHGDGHETWPDMPGMLTDDELLALAEADGADFDRLWLEGMTRHHEGALVMVERLYADGGGREQAVSTLATHITGDQRTEIARMREMLAEL